MSCRQTLIGMTVAPLNPLLTTISGKNWDPKETANRSAEEEHLKLVNADLPASTFDDSHLYQPSVQEPSQECNVRRARARGAQPVALITESSNTEPSHTTSSPAYGEARNSRLHRRGRAPRAGEATVLRPKKRSRRLRSDTSVNQQDAVSNDECAVEPVRRSHRKNKGKRPRKDEDGFQYISEDEVEPGQGASIEAEAGRTTPPPSEEVQTPVQPVSHARQSTLRRDAEPRRNGSAHDSVRQSRNCHMGT